jgi:hypothetical protein
MTAHFSFQPDFRLPLPEIDAPKEFLEKRALYETIDDMLRRSGADERFVSLAIEQARETHKLRKKAAGGEEASSKEAEQEALFEPQPKFLEHSFRALRCNIVRFVEKNMPVRELSNKLADSHLFQWFCHIGSFGPIKVPSKSTLDRYLRWVDKERLESLIVEVLQCASGTGQCGSRSEENGSETGEISQQEQDNSHQRLGLEKAVDLSEVWFDSTCLKADIHFPTDWVLLIDATRTLMLATVLIRNAGLKNRMPQSPEAFLGEMNKLGIAMSQQRRQADSKTKRKKILRSMKQLVDRIERHARAHLQLLEDHWEETDLSPGNAARIAGRIEAILEQLPQAKKQAHERIIGGRQVPSKEKILSLYDESLNVIVRGKLGREVEFGNGLLLGEQRDGLIVDWLLNEENEADSNLLLPGIDRLHARFGGIVSKATGDRGFHSAANDKGLEERRVQSALCPRDITKLREKMKDADFAASQKRRSQTEGRVSILTRRFLGTPLKAKGFNNREQCVHWAVFAHNLWVLGRMRLAQEAKKRQEEHQEAHRKRRKQPA